MSRGRLTSLPLLLLVALCIGCSTTASTQTASPTPISAAPRSDNELASARVMDVIDGVTIDVEGGGRKVRVRYLGLEIPEAVASSAEGRALVEDAHRFNHYLVEGETVQLERDGPDTDSSGRLLRYVYVNGEMVNLALLANGYASVSRSPREFAHRTAFAIAEESARKGEVGIWEPAGSAGTSNGASTDEPFTGGTLPLPLRAKCDYSGTSQAVIQGNVDPRTGERIFHVPGGFFYETTVVSESDGDRWFCTEVEAIAAGWKRSKH